MKWNMNYMNLFFLSLFSTQGNVGSIIKTKRSRETGTKGNKTEYKSPQLRYIYTIKITIKQ